MKQTCFIYLDKATCVCMLLSILYAKQLLKKGKRRTTKVNSFAEYILTLNTMRILTKLTPPPANIFKLNPGKI